MPKHISKTLSITLFNEEAEAWKKLEAYLLKRRVAHPEQFDFRKPTVHLIYRDVLQFAAERLAAEIGPEVAQKLAVPPAISDFQAAREARKIETLAAKALATKPGVKKKAVKKVPPKPTSRTTWNGPGGRSGSVGSRSGATE